ncbi:MAG: flagellar basal body-associated FliL family protein [Pseudomonadota bacterium]
MRTMIIAAAALAVLGGGAAGAYYYFGQSAKASIGPDGKPIEVADKHEKEDHAAPVDNEYVELDPLILPILDGNGVSQTLSVVIAIEVPDVGTANKVEKMTPKLKDAYIEDLYGVLNEQAAYKGGVLQIAKIKKRLTRITDSVMGKGTVSGVLLQVVQQRPI